MLWLVMPPEAANRLMTYRWQCLLLHTKAYLWSSQQPSGNLHASETPKFRNKFTGKRWLEIRSPWFKNHLLPRCLCLRRAGTYLRAAASCAAWIPACSSAEVLAAAGPDGLQHIISHHTGLTICISDYAAVKVYPAVSA